MQAILRSDRGMEAKLSELLPLRELLSGEVFGDIPEVAGFVEENWYHLSKILFYVRIYDVDGFHKDLLDLLIKHTPPHVKKEDTVEEIESLSA